MSLLNKVGPCGGIGGTVKDMDINGVTRIVKIDIRHGNSIDAITIRYERNSREESTDLWGGQGGKLTEISLQPTEYITSVRGYIASWGTTRQVRSLKLETNLNTYGPYGNEEGVPFELPALGGRIIGFHARAGSMLEAIGVYVKKLESPVEPFIKKVGLCGDGSGVLARDMDINGVTRIVKIGIRHGNSIDALIIRYERNGLEESTDLWGGQGGQLTEINLQPNEYITSVRGYIAPWKSTLQVRSLKLETNIKTYGPYGIQEGAPFELPSFGGRIIGFHARAGSMLEAIGVYVKVTGANDGGSTGGASIGTWTQNENNSWGGASGGGSTGGITTGTWTQSENNSWGGAEGGGSTGGASTGAWTQSENNSWGRSS